MKYITLLITLPLTLIAALFAVSNTQSVDVFLYPDSKAYALSTGMVALAALGAGFLFGALFVWLHDQKVRLNAWKLKKKAERLEKDLEQLQKKLEVFEPAVDRRPLSKVPSRFSFLALRKP